VNPPLDRGASAVEYGLMIAAVAAVITLAVFSFGGAVRQSFTHTTDCLVSEINAQC
jgi:pilus assembly protein Flp/PilA